VGAISTWAAAAILDRKDHGPAAFMGHEIVGVVEALGPDAKGAKVGDRQ
jgi:threonine dehydrogenase-like Zn-dependent dehydrogenase